MKTNIPQKQFGFLVVLVCIWILVLIYSMKYKSTNNFVTNDMKLVHTVNSIEINANYHRSSKKHRHESKLLLIENFVKRPINNQTILFYYKPQHFLSDWIGNRWDSGEIFENCPVPYCKITRDKGYFNKADAVIFRRNRLTKCLNKTKYGQVWILFEHEAPKGIIFKPCFKNSINWTMTYRRDSDFLFVFGHFSKAKQWYNDSALIDLLRSKTKTAVGFISHCNALSERDKYIQTLRANGLDIDLYGKCGNNLYCPKRNRNAPAWNISLNMTDDCFDVLDSTYRFYLSFENNLCVDYVTEKSLRLILYHHVLPVIRDASNHSLFHPPKSYIDTKDYGNAKSLVKHLKYLEKNTDEMKEYYNWRKHYSAENVNDVFQTNFCNICQRLHNKEKYKRVYKDIMKFYNFTREGSPVCRKAEDLEK